MFILGGESKISITHVTATINELERETKKYQATRLPVFGETLLWRRFEFEDPLMKLHAFCGEQCIGTVTVKVPILPCTIEPILSLVDADGDYVGTLRIKLTHVR